MSVWNNPTVAQAVAHILKSEFYTRAMREVGDKNEGVSYELWAGIDRLHHEYSTAMGAHLMLMMRDYNGTRDLKRIEHLRDLEIKTAFVSALFYLTHEDDQTRRRAERRVQNVINGELPTFQGATIGTQFRRMLENSDIRVKPNKARVNVTNDLH